VITRFIDSYPDQNVSARLPNVVSDYPTNQELAAWSDDKFRVADNTPGMRRMRSAGPTCSELHAARLISSQ
jgi:hypothetical protein